MIFDFDGTVSELVMYVEARMNDRIEVPAPEKPKANTVQVVKYGSVEQVFEEIEGNVQEREILGVDAIAVMADTPALETIADLVLVDLPVMF